MHHTNFVVKFSFLGRLLRVCLSTKSYSDFNEIFLHHGMPYHPIQVQGHGGLKRAMMADFKVHLLCM